MLDNYIYEKVENEEWTFVLPNSKNKFGSESQKRWVKLSIKDSSISKYKFLDVLIGIRGSGKYGKRDWHSHFGIKPNQKLEYPVESRSPMSRITKRFVSKNGDVVASEEQNFRKPSANNKKVRFDIRPDPSKKIMSVLMVSWGES